MQGWIKLHREILESDLWNDVTTFRLFSYLLLKASHKDGVKIQGIEINRGQWIRSYRKLASDLAYKEGRGLKEYSLKTIEKCVKKLVRSETITIQETKQGTLFTIVNYAKYQDETASEKETVNGTVLKQETNGKRTVNNNKNANNAKNAKKNNSSSPKFEIYDLELAELLFKRMQENNPSVKQPNLNKWAEEVRLMRERDQRTVEQIKYLINWTQQNEFWKANILSISKLRKQWDQLVLKAKEQNSKTKQPVIQKSLSKEDFDLND